MKERIPDLVVDGMNIDTNIQKVEEFNNYFSSVFTKDNGLVQNFPISQLPAELTNCSFTNENVLEALKNLKTNLSSGPDGFPPVLFEKLKYVIASPLRTIFEISLRTNKLPEVWLQSNVTVIHKKGSKQSVENYRPISLTCVACKLMESIIKNRVMNFLDHNKMLDRSQFGFRTGRSTCTQLIQCTNDWTTYLDEKAPVDVIYLDFAKAFDTVCHYKLFEKLSNIGIKGDLLLWIKAFLTNRSQKVVIDQITSQPASVISGVPQGSVLGPVLFLVYINDLTKNIEKDVKCVMFADDVKLYRVVRSDTDSYSIQNTLNHIQNWCKTWQIELSINKCNVLHLGKINPKKDYFIEGKVLTNATQCRDLGVLMTEDGKFSKHVKFIAKTAYFKMSTIFKIFQSKNIQLLKKAYISYVRPSLEYCSIIWSPYYIQDINLIERVQKYFTKRILGKLKLTYPERLKYLAIDSLEERRIKIDLAETFKFLNCEHRKSTHFFEMNPNPHNHSRDLYIKFYRTNARKFWFGNRVCPWWNKLPSHIKQSKNINQFKKLISKYDVKPFCRGLISTA
jgi:hypothetical protein